MTQASFTVSVAAIILNDNGEVLLLDHVLRPASGWGIPGGFLNHNEQPENAICRELFEETGIELSEVKLLGVRTVHRHIEILFQSKSNDAATAKSHEIKAAQWFKVNEMPENMHQNQKSLIEKLLKDNL